MKNKQLDTKDLLMNKKEELIWRVIEREEYGHRERGRYRRY